LFSAIQTRLAHYLLVLYPAAILGLVCLIPVVPIKGLHPKAATAAAVALFTVTLWSQPNASYPQPGFLERDFGSAARELPGDIYTLDWYAPVLGYYARKSWRLMATDDRLLAIMRAHRTLAGALLDPPRWPPGTFLLAGPEARLRSAGLHIQKVVALDSQLALVLAQAP
jgi:hypothetical protein